MLNDSAGPPAEPVPSARSGDARRRRVSSHWLAVGLMLGVGLGLVLAVLVVWRISPKLPPPLTTERLAEALERWQIDGPANYAMEVEVFGRQQSRMQVEVRGGEVTSLRAERYEPARHTWDDWSVPALLRIVRRELDEGRHAPEKFFGAPPGATVEQFAEFDAELGYPRQYRRFVSGTDQEIGWRIEGFRRLE